MGRGALHGEGVVPEPDDDDHDRLGEHLHVQPDGRAVTETGHPYAVERGAAEEVGDLPAVLGIVIPGAGPT